MFLRKRKVSPALSEEAQSLYQSLKSLPQLDAFTNPITRNVARRLQNSVWGETKKELDFSHQETPISFSGVDGIRISTDSFSADRPVIMYIHAGGFVCGSPSDNAAAVIPTCHLARCDAYAVQYSLAPEAPFPQALNEIDAFYQQLLNVIPSDRPVVLVGDSAGGNLVLSSLVSWRDKGVRLPSKAVMISPVLDGTASSDTMLTMQKHDPLIKNRGGTSISALFRHYSNGTDVTDPRVSPLHADLRGLPPLMIQVGSREVLLGDSARLSERARQAGVDVHLRVLDGMFHMFHLHWSLPEAKAVHEDIANFLTS